MRDIHRGPARFQDEERADAAVGRLVAEGRAIRETVQTGGRPSVMVRLVNATAPVAEAVPAAAAGDKVKSPMVGTVYLSSQPGADTFVKVGQSVAEGQTLLIVEAMKTLNPIPSPRAGKIVEILVSDAQPVEFGEPLVIIE